MGSLSGAGPASGRRADVARETSQPIGQFFEAVGICGFDQDGLGAKSLALGSEQIPLRRSQDRNRNRAGTVVGFDLLQNFEPSHPGEIQIKQYDRGFFSGISGGMSAGGEEVI